ncbi:MAG: alpha-glucosidase, partial [Sphingomonas bacterium]|nr:alpha-glucosidase [Sphingomonas bacterium]
LDAITCAMHDPALRDNPPAPDTGAPRTRPFDFQHNIHNQRHPNLPAFLERLRALTDAYGTCFTVAEVGGAAPERAMHAITAGNHRLNSAYGFNFLYADKLTPSLVRTAAEQWPDEPGMGWPSWAFENHDAPRAVSRWAAPEHRTAFAAMKMLLLVSLRGNIFLYQGEELGLTQVELPFDRLRDPEAIANWPLTLGRDGARTPMPWVADAPFLGFSTAEPWLPTGPDHAALAVDLQEADPDSLLALTRKLLALRKANPALRTGDLRIVEASDAVLVFERTVPGQRLLCVFNLRSTPQSWQTADAGHWRTIERIGEIADGSLGPYAAFIAEPSL